MKKALILLLALALVLPMALLQPAKADVTAEPFYALGWSDFDREKYPYLEGLHTTNFSNIGEFAYLGGQMLYGKYTDEDVTIVAEKVKKAMLERPEGTRYWHVFGISQIMKLAPEHVVYLDHGVEQMREMFEAVIKKLKELDCPLDGVVIDVEYIGMSSHYLYANTSHNSNNFQTNPKIYAQIVKHPDYATKIRPLLVERGFPFWPNPSGNQSEIYSICKLNKGEQYDLARSIWDVVMRIHLNNYSNYWCYEPLKAYYPNASLSDYQSHDSDSWLKLAGITDDGVALTGGNGQKVGTASSFSYYYARPGKSFFNEHKQYVGFNDGEYEASAFNGLLYDVNFTRHMLSSTDTKQIAPWITSYMYDGKKPSSMAYTPYYSELLYHLGMFDPEPFLSYTYVNEYKEEGKDPSYTSPKYLKTQQVMNEIMAELTRVAGYSDRKTIEMPQYWNAEFVVSGMYCGGRNIWRITPNTDEVSLEGFKVNAKDPTFSVKGQTITFPGGKILDSATISEVGSCGYWVETAANVTPVMTSDTNRYAKYPSFQENFNSYADGELTLANMNSGYAWSYNSGKGTIKVANKALALTGELTLSNTTIPAKITAGDSYAEDQTWELKFTIPKDLSADAEIYLLKYQGDAMRSYDGGIKIQNGKLFYGTAEGNRMNYVELTDIKPGSYTLKRVMDMNNSGAFYYDMFVLDASGKEVASVKDVATATFTNITAISFGVKGADKAVTFDDYKLYPSGITTDFELYDAVTGMNVKGQEAQAPRAKSTAYRLSWLNGTSAEKTCTLMAAIYENGKLVSQKTVKTLTMKPGCDGVETGIVEVAKGQSVLVYLKGSAAEPKPDQPVTGPTQATTGTAQTSATTATKPGNSQVTKVTKPGETAPVQTTGATQVTGETAAPQQTTAPSTTDEQLPTGADQTAAPSQPADKATQATEKQETDGKGVKAVPVMIPLAAVVVALAAAGAAVYFLVIRKKPTAEAPKTEETPKPEE